MRTQVMHERAAGLPWLEHYPVDGGPQEQTALDDFPFVIGRSEDSDLPIDSNRISRRHAQILRDEDGYRLRDLGSTNGTFLNGRRIDEARLCDGDLFVVADLELTFFAGRASDARDMVTQAISFRESWDSESGEDCELVRAVRQLDEMLAHRAIVVRFEPVVELESGEVFAYRLCEAVEPRGGVPVPEQLILKTDCRLSGRYRRLKRMLAVEQSVELPHRAAVFLTLDEVEIGDAALRGSLERLAEAISDMRPLVAVVSQRAVSDAAHFRELLGWLRTVGIRLAYDGVAGAPLTELSQMQLRPDYLILAQSLTREIHRSPRQQRQLKALLQASNDSGCEVIATALRRQEDAEFCCRLGCRYGQGELHAGAEPAMAADACSTN